MRVCVRTTPQAQQLSKATPEQHHNSSSHILALPTAVHLFSSEVKTFLGCHLHFAAPRRHRPSGSRWAYSIGGKNLCIQSPIVCSLHIINEVYGWSFFRQRNTPSVFKSKKKRTRSFVFSVLAVQTKQDHTRWVHASLGQLNEPGRRQPNALPTAEKKWRC